MNNFINEKKKVYNETKNEIFKKNNQNSNLLIYFDSFYSFKFI